MEFLVNSVTEHNDVLDEFSSSDSISACARLDVHIREAQQVACEVELEFVVDVELQNVVDDQVFQIRCKVWIQVQSMELEFVVDVELQNVVDDQVFQIRCKVWIP